MSKKWKRRLLQLFGFIIGMILGAWRAETIHSVFPIIGISIGIGYFFLLRQPTQNGKEIEDIPWFTLLQMFTYFLIGAALSSGILLTLSIL